MRSLFLVVERRIFFLKMAGVGQHHRAEFDRRLGREDRTAKPLLDQTRNPAAMVKVSVRENDCINLARRNRRVLPVALAPFLLSLKHSAIDQNLKPLFASRVGRSIDEMFRAGNGPGSAKKLDVGQ
jgi:hypothetical protein